MKLALGLIAGPFTAICDDNTWSEGFLPQENLSSNEKYINKMKEEARGAILYLRVQVREAHNKARIYGRNSLRSARGFVRGRFFPGMGTGKRARFLYTVRALNGLLGRFPVSTDRR